MTRLRIDLATLTSPRRSRVQWAAPMIFLTSASSHTSRTCNKIRTRSLANSFQFTISLSGNAPLTFIVPSSIPWAAVLSES